MHLECKIGGGRWTFFMGRWEWMRVRGGIFWVVGGGRILLMDGWEFA